MSSAKTIVVSAPGKIHLLGEHSVVYGKPALLAAVNLRVSVILNAMKDLPRMRDSNELRDSSAKTPQNDNLKKIIEPIIKKYLKIKTIPPYHVEISSQVPIGAGLGSSAAVSAAYIGALLSFLKVKWDLNLINKLTYEAEKVFHGNPSGGDNTTVVYGGLISYIKGGPIQPLPFSIPKKLAKNFVLINTGAPAETTRQMVEIVSSQFTVHSSQFQKIFDDQERLVRELLPAIETGNEKELIRIIRAGEKNLERIGVVSPYAKSIIRQIEKAGGAGKICGGGGGKTKATGIILAYHQDKAKIEKVAQTFNLPIFKVALGAEGLRNE